MSSSTQASGHLDGTCKRWFKKIIKPIARPLLNTLRWRGPHAHGRLNQETCPASSRFEFDVMLTARGVAASGQHWRYHPASPINPGRTISQMRIGFVGNIANNAYSFVKCLRRRGSDCELVVENGSIDAFIMNRPFWEDVDVECQNYEQGLSFESRWQQPTYVRTVAFDAALQQKYHNRYSAIAEVQTEYKAAFGVELPADLA